MFYRQIAIDAIEKTMAAASSSGMLDQPGIKGRMREIVIEELVKPFLSPRIKAVTGTIVDAHGNLSSQIDVILYDEQVTPPILFSEGIGVIPCHSVVATIEVKSKMTRGELKDAVENARSVKFLHYDYHNIPISGERIRLILDLELINLLPDEEKKKYWREVLTPIRSPACYAFAFTSDLVLDGARKDELGRLLEVVEESNQEKRIVKVPISGLCVADRSFQYCQFVKPDPLFEVEIADVSTEQRTTPRPNGYQASHNVVLEFLNHIVNVCNIYADQRWRIPLNTYFRPPEK
jgi:hypothetical protein